MVFCAALALLTLGAYAQSEQPVESRLLNGLKVLVFKKPAEQKVTIKLRIHSGAAFDPLGKEGTMELLSRALFPNAELKDFFQDDLGGSLAISAGYDFIQIDATASADKLLDALEAIAAGVATPQINKEVTAKVKADLLASLSASEGDPAYEASQATANALVGNFPYGRPSKGSTASVQRIDFADLLQADERFATADNATLVVSGNVDPSFVSKAVKRFLGGWNKADRKVPATFAQPEAPKQNLLARESGTVPAGTAVILSGVRTLPFKDSRYPAATVLTAAIRQRLASAFPDGAVFADFGRALPGVLVFGGKKVTDGVKDSAPVNLLSSDLSVDEFDSAKNEVLKNISGSNSMDLWLDSDTYGAGKPDVEIARFKAVTIADVRAVQAAFRNGPTVTTVFTAPAAKGN